MSISGKTKITGIFGQPVEYSLSPAMHNAAYTVLGLNYCYLPFSVTKENLETAVASLRALNLRGVNITSPHKENVIPYLDHLSPEASFLQAVNVIVNKDGVLTGHNTDAAGYRQGLLQDIDQVEIASGKAVILGGGGAARAAALGLIEVGLKTIFFAIRQPEKLLPWVARYKEKYGQIQMFTISLASEELDAQLKEATVLVNALPISLKDAAGDWLIDLTSLSAQTFVSDLRYAPAATELLSFATARGCRTQNGLPLLLEQGILSFVLFAGVNPPERIMRESISEIVGN